MTEQPTPGMKPRTGPFDAILIDIDDTLMDFRESSREALIAAGQQLSLALTEEDFAAFTVLNESLWDQAAHGVFPVEHIFDTRFATFFEERGIDASGPAMEKAFEVCLYDTHVLFPDADAFLDTLSTFCPVYAASNAPRGQQEKRCQAADIDRYFAGYFLSGDIGFSKPEPGFFAACLEYLGVRNPSGVQEPSRVLMIGDAPKADIQGAHDAGLKTFWIQRRGQEPVPGICPDYAASSLEEALEELLPLLTP